MAYWRLNEAAGATQFQPEAGFGTVPLDAHDGTRALGGAVNDSGPGAGVLGAPLAGEPDNKAVFLPNTGPWNWFSTRWDDYLVTNSPIDLSGTGDWTLEMWFRHADADASGYPWGDSSTSEDLMGNEDIGVSKDALLIEIDGIRKPGFRAKQVPYADEVRRGRRQYGDGFQARHSGVGEHRLVRLAPRRVHHAGGHRKHFHGW